MSVLKPSIICMLFVVILWVLLTPVLFTLSILALLSIICFIALKVSSLELNSCTTNKNNVVDTVSSLPTVSKLLGWFHYSYLKHEVLWLLSEERNINLLRGNNAQTNADIDKTISSKIAMSNAKAQAHANATAYAPLVNKEVQAPDLGADVNLDELNHKKEIIRNHLTQRINEYNDRIDALIFWRNDIFRGWYMDKIGFPTTSCFPRHINDNKS